MIEVITNLINILFILSLLLVLLFSYIDYKKKRVIKEYPFVSFIISTYNDEKFIEKTIESIYNSYEKSKFEIFIINDNSTDNTLSLLKKLHKNFKFHLINNKINKGKAKSINEIFVKTNGNVIWVIDSDSLVTKKGVEDIILRLNNPKIAGVSCRSRVLNRGFWPTMLNIDYTILALFQQSCNINSTVSLWGGCMAVKRKAFEEVGLFSQNILVEDMELGLKLNKAGWKIEQSFYPFYTYAPEKFKHWFKQKIRWEAGLIQCISKYPKIFLKNPISIIFIFSYSLSIILFMYIILKNGIFIFNSLQIKEILFAGIIYPLISLPYILIDIKSFKETYKIILIYPFSIIYYPIYLIVALIASIKGLSKTREIKKIELTGWKGDN